MKTLQAFTIKYLGATSTKGSRVSIKDNRFNQSKTISWDYSHNTSYEIAQEYLESIGFNIVAVSELKNGYMLLSDTFEPLKGE